MPTKKTKPKPPLRGLAQPDPKGETLRAVQAYVESGGNVNKLFEEGAVFMEPLLHLAITNHHTAIVTYLLAHGADPELANGTSGERALHVAIAADDSAAVALLLDHGADPNAATINGALALHDAIIMQDAKTVELLLAHGADVTRTIRHAKQDCDALHLCDALRVGKRIKALVAKSTKRQ